eukprot:ctg_1654.g288
MHRGGATEDGTADAQPTTAGGLVGLPRHVDPEVVDGIARRFGIDPQSEAWRLDTLVGVYERYLRALVDTTSVVRIPEVRQLKELKRAFRLSNADAGDAHFQAAARFKRDNFVYIDNYVLAQGLGTATESGAAAEADPFQQRAREVMRGISKVLFLSARVLDEPAETEEGYRYEMTRLRNVFEVSEEELEARMSEIAVPFYEKAVQSALKQVRAGAQLDASRLKAAREALGVSVATAGRINLSAYTAFVKEQLMQHEGERVPKLSAEDRELLQRAAAPLQIADDEAMEALKEAAEPIYRKDVERALELTDSSGGPSQFAQLLVRREELAFLNLPDDEVMELHGRLCAGTYTQSVEEAMGSTGIIPELYRDGLERLQMRLNLSPEKARELFLEVAEAVDARAGRAARRRRRPVRAASGRSAGHRDRRGDHRAEQPGGLLPAESDRPGRGRPTHVPGEPAGRVRAAHARGDVSPVPDPGVCGQVAHREGAPLRQPGPAGQHPRPDAGGGERGALDDRLEGLRVSAQRAEHAGHAARGVRCVVEGGAGGAGHRAARGDVRAPESAARRGGRIPAGVSPARGGSGARSAGGGGSALAHVPHRDRSRHRDRRTDRRPPGAVARGAGRPAVERRSGAPGATVVHSGAMRESVGAGGGIATAAERAADGARTDQHVAIRAGAGHHARVCAVSAGAEPGGGGVAARSPAGVSISRGADAGRGGCAGGNGLRRHAHLARGDGVQRDGAEPAATGVERDTRPGAHSDVSGAVGQVSGGWLAGRRRGASVAAFADGVECVGDGGSGGISPRCWPHLPPGHRAHGGRSGRVYARQAAAQRAGGARLAPAGTGGAVGAHGAVPRAPDHPLPGVSGAPVGRCPRRRIAGAGETGAGAAAEMLGFADENAPIDAST